MDHRDLRGYVTWQRLRRLVQSEPREVLAQGQAALRLADPALHPRIFAVAASALRATDQLDAALALLEQALDDAKALGDLWAEADILQRQGVALENLGEIEKALQKARAATGIHASLGNTAGTGRAILDQGIFYYHLGRLDEAAFMFRRALGFLPHTETNHRLAAFSNLAQVYMEEGRLRLALRCARAATLVTGAGRLTQAESLETQGRLALELGRFGEAERAFRDAAEIFRVRGAYLSCAYSTIWLCKVLTLRGALAEVQELARASASLIGHLKQSRFAAGAVAELAAQGAAGRAITTTFLERLQGEIERSRGAT